MTKSFVIQPIAFVLLAATLWIQPALATPRTKPHYEGWAFILLEKAGWDVYEVYPDGKNTVISLKDGRILRYGKTELGDFAFLEGVASQGPVRIDQVRINHVRSEIEVRLYEAGKPKDTALPSQDDTHTQLDDRSIGILPVPKGERVLYASLERIRKTSLPILKVALQNSSAEIQELSYRILQDGSKGLSFEKLPKQDRIEASRFSFLKPLACKASLE